MRPIVGPSDDTWGKGGIVGNLANTWEPHGPPPERAGRYLPPNKTARERGYPGSGGSVTIPSTPVLRRARPTRSIGAASPSPLPSSPGYLHPSLSSSPGHPHPYGRLVTHRSTAPSALHPDRGPIATPGPCGMEWLHPSSPNRTPEPTRIPRSPRSMVRSDYPPPGAL